MENTKSYIPNNFDILCAGFPCQAFSLAGKRLGFEETRGTLFFDVAEILRRKQPKAFFLENVKGLMIHDKGKTLKTILNTLDEVGYVVPKPEIVNAMYFGVPQHRERIYIVGFRKDLGIKPEDFTYPEQKEVTKHFIDIREKDPVPSKYYLSTTYVDTLIRHKARHESKGNGFGYAIVGDNEVANALLLRYSKSITSWVDIIKELNIQNPLDYRIEENYSVYEIKIARFLQEVAMGMTPETPWRGFYDADGGQIVVKKDGNIVCYHIYELNRFRQYLLNATRLEQPATGEDENNPGHEKLNPKTGKPVKPFLFGWLYPENGNYFLKINLQVRFK